MTTLPVIQKQSSQKSLWFCPRKEKLKPPRNDLLCILHEKFKSRILLNPTLTWGKNFDKKNNSAGLVALETVTQKPLQLRNNLNVQFAKDELFSLPLSLVSSLSLFAAFTPTRYQQATVSLQVVVLRKVCMSSLWDGQLFPYPTWSETLDTKACVCLFKTCLLFPFKLPMVQLRIIETNPW